MMPDRAPHIDDATYYQILAADPDRSPLVSANAGSGKTHVLISRVSRLLLDEVPPEKILCLTYTKAAANEMQTRLFDTLGEWSVIDADSLNASLNTLMGVTQDRDTHDLAQARKLFAKALETPEGLKVQTIHAFCSQLLTRFPLEAGILPGFEPMEDTEIKQLCRESEDYLHIYAYNNPDSEVAQALAHLAQLTARQTQEQLFAWIGQNGTDVQNWINVGIKPLLDALGTDLNHTERDIFDRAWDMTDLDAYKAFERSLRDSPNVSDTRLADRLADMLNADTAEQAFNILQEVFFTGKGEVRKSPVTGKASAIEQAFFGIKATSPTAEALRVGHVFEDVLALRCAKATYAVFVLAKAFHGHYTREKMRRRWLDFNDQIDKVRDLILRSEVRDWIRYKLDGGIAHILVDEAQDTSPEQWQIIDILRQGLTEIDPDTQKSFFAVGDEKQSIFSFQGARPEIFLSKVQAYTRTAPDAAIRMSTSFRSCRDILDAVDQVFVRHGRQARMFNLDALDDVPLEANHIAQRDDRGYVELWPLATRADTLEDDAFALEHAVDAVQSSDSRQQLAAGLARTLRERIDARDPIYDRHEKRTRPLTAGDVLILVEKRDAFYAAMFEQLRAHNVPVAPSDRITVTDDLFVRDLLALSEFICLPLNDLALAEVLKGPLLGWSDEDLFDIAYTRTASLWHTLCAQQTPLAQQASAILTELLAQPRRLTPYGFYKFVLEQKDGHGRSGLYRFHQRLGSDHKDALDAFLDFALAHEQKGAPSLQAFLEDMQHNTTEIKREMESGDGHVRIMTLHSSKGLQAPLVILPQTTLGKGRNTDNLLMPLDNGFVFAGKGFSAHPVLQTQAEHLKSRTFEERMRLLYVGMTRAESHLILAGYHTGHENGVGFEKDSWYPVLSEAFSELDTTDLDTPFGTGKIFGLGPERVQFTPEVHAPKDILLPDWAHRPPPARQNTSKARLTPSRLGMPSPTSDPSVSEPPVRSPLSQQTHPYSRGTLIHRLLELLPPVARAQREQVARNIIDQHKDVPPEAYDRLIEEVFDVLDHPEFSDLFGPNSEAEVSFAGHLKNLPGAPYISGQIDRLFISETDILIVDYKSNRPPPKRAEDVAEVYIAQMAAYREILRDLYPKRSVRCALLWTDIPYLMSLPEDMMDDILTRLPSVLT